MGAEQAAAQESVTVEVRDGVGVITLTGPALTTAAKQQLLAGLRRAAGDAGVRSVVLTGSGRVFCAGQDLGEHAAALAADPGSAFGTLEADYHPIVLALTTMAKPVIAAINGTCAGAGISLALACDLRVCAETAKFATAFTGIGLTFDSGLSATLARAVGAARASELILLAEPFTAAQALAWGLVGRLAEPDAVLAESVRLATRLAAGPTLAYAAAKQAIQDAAAPPLAQVLAAEQQAQARLGLTQDHRDAVTAFLARERPQFHGR